MLWHALLEEVPHRAKLCAIGSLAESVHIVQNAEHITALFFFHWVDLLALDDSVDKSADAVDDELEGENDESPGIVE